MVGAEGVAWFLLGEGSITIRIGKSKYGLGYIATPHVRFYNTEFKLLNEIKNWLDFNNILSTITVQKKKKSKIHHDYFCLEVCRVNEIEKLLNLLQPYLIGKKFELSKLLSGVIPVFKNSHPHLLRKNHKFINKPDLKREKERFIEIIKCAEEITKITDRPTHPRKYSYNYFKNLWGL